MCVVKSISDSTQKWLVDYARRYFVKHKKEGLDVEDCLVVALEELDDGFGIYYDPTREEYNELIEKIRWGY